MLSGFDGNDQLIGGAGNDVLNGGTGSDTASYATATAGVTVTIDDLNFPSGGPQDTGGAGSDTLVDIENLTGSTFNDSLWIYSIGNSTINGGDGDDDLSGDGTFNGGKGEDTLTALDAARLNGGADNDVLWGSLFFDSYLNGGAGTDELHYLGGGNDIYDYNAVSDSRASTGIDKIFRDFWG